jgi:hypothetical protein
MKYFLIFLAVVIGAGGLIAFAVEENAERKIIEESHRRDAEYHKRFVEEERAKAAALKENRIKAFMKENPSWSHHDAESHIIAEDIDTKKRSEEEQGKSNITRGCELLYGETKSKSLGNLTVEEARQIQACEALGLYQ